MRQVPLAGVLRHEQHSKTFRRCRIRPDRPQIGPWDFAEHPSAIAGIPVTTTAATVFHAAETPQSLLQNPVAGLTRQLRQESNAAGILLSRDRLGRWTVPIGPERCGTGGFGHGRRPDKRLGLQRCPLQKPSVPVILGRRLSLPTRFHAAPRPAA